MYLNKNHHWQNGIFVRERRMCYLQTPQEIKSIDDMQSQTVVMGLQGKEFKLEDLQTDIKKVERALQKNLESFMPLGFSMFGEGILAGTNLASNERIHGLRVATRAKINALSEKTQDEYKRLTAAEMMLEEVLNRMETKRENLVKRREALVAGLEAAQQLRAFPFRHLHPLDNWKKRRFKKAEIQGIDDQREFVRARKEEIAGKKLKLEAQIDEKLDAHKGVKDNLIKFFTSGGLTEAQANAILNGIAKGEIRVSQSKYGSVIYNTDPSKSNVAMGYASFFTSLTKREKEIVGRMLTIYQKKSARIVHRIETEKGNLAKLKDYQGKWAEYGKTNEGDKKKVPKLKINGQDVPAGEYRTVEVSNDKRVYLREDDIINNDDFAHNVLVYDINKKEWKFGEKTELESDKMIEKIALQIDKMQRKIIDKIKDFKQYFTSPGHEKGALKYRIDEIKKANKVMHKLYDDFGGNRNAQLRLKISNLDQKGTYTKNLAEFKQIIQSINP